MVTVNRVILRREYTVDDLQERVAELCENVKTYRSDTGFVGGFRGAEQQSDLQRRLDHRETGR